jgi:hypothetical protein
VGGGLLINLDTMISLEISNNESSYFIGRNKLTGKFQQSNITECPFMPVLLSCPYLFDKNVFAIFT